MKKVLTFSVAAYNIEDTIDEMMQSLIDSGCMDQIEVLVIDDGSKDQTAEKAAAYERAYPETVRLISKENGGHGSTINKGIEEAKGKYFRTLDGDDWIESGNLGGLIEELQKTEADMVICDYYRCYSNGKKEIYRMDAVPCGRLLPAEEALQTADWLCYHSVIYKTQLLQEHTIHLDEHCFYVDNEYCLFPILYTETILYYNQPIYCYRVGEDGQSISPSSRMKHIENGRRVADRMIEFCAAVPDSIEKGKRRYIIHETARHCIWFIYSLLLFPASKEKEKEIREFDQMVWEKQRCVYEEMEKRDKFSRIIKLMRKSDYRAYWIIKAYKTIKGTY